MLEPMNSQLALLASTLVTGIPTRDATGRYNSIIALGAGSGTYHKQKLVPSENILPRSAGSRCSILTCLCLSSSQARDSGPFGSRVSLSLPSSVTEIVYPDFVQRHAADADVLITCNDTWFSQAVGWQHFQMALSHR